MKDGVSLPGMLVSGSYFNVLGTQPLLGRLLTPGDAPAPGGNAVAVLRSTRGGLASEPIQTSSVNRSSWDASHSKSSG